MAIVLVVRAHDGGSRLQGEFVECTHQAVSSKIRDTQWDAQATAAQNKFMHTPQGIFELKYFFNSSVSRSGGDNLASASVKKMIADIIKNEDPRKPLADQKIVDMLDERGIQLARRTVAKYREQMGILPSSKRKKYF